MVKKIQNKSKKIVYITSIRKGGPYFVLKNLAFKNKADFYASFRGFFLGFFFKKYDIIHTSLPIFFNIWNKKIVFHLHGNFCKERHLYKNPLGYIYPLAIKFANKIILPSNFLASKLKLKNFKVIPNPVNESVFNFKKKSYEILEEVNLVIMTKFHFYEKSRGILDLVKLLNRLNKKINLYILGDGIYLKEIQNKIIANSNLKVYFKGFVENPYDFIVKQDIFVYYSFLDTFGVVLIEAMALGLPVITNNFGAENEVVLNNSNGFVGNSSKDYLEKLKLLIENKTLRENFGRNGRIFVKENFSLSFINNEFIKEYDLLFNKRENEKR